MAQFGHQLPQTPWRLVPNRLPIHFLSRTPPASPANLPSPTSRGGGCTTMPEPDGLIKPAAVAFSSRVISNILKKSELVTPRPTPGPTSPQISYKKAFWSLLEPSGCREVQKTALALCLVRFRPPLKQLLAPGSTHLPLWHFLGRGPRKLPAMGSDSRHSAPCVL